MKSAKPRCSSPRRTQALSREPSCSWTEDPRRSKGVEERPFRAASAMLGSDGLQALLSRDRASRPKSCSPLRGSQHRFQECAPSISADPTTLRDLLGTFAYPP